MRGNQAGFHLLLSDFARLQDFSRKKKTLRLKTAAFFRAFSYTAKITTKISDNKAGTFLFIFFQQEVMVKEKLAAIGKPLRKFASTPNLAAAVRVILCCLFVCLFVCLFELLSDNY